MASNQKNLRLYDINANKHHDRGAYNDYRSPSVSSESPSLTSPINRSFTRSPIPSPIPSPLGPPVAVETRQDIEYTRAPDMFPCGHILCHNCVRKFMQRIQRFGMARCPVCHCPLDGDPAIQAMGFSNSNSNSNSKPPQEESLPQAPPASAELSDPTPISLLNNFDEMVAKFNGIQHNLKRLKNESVQSKSMGMTFTNTQCHLCLENHGTLRIVQEYNQLSVKHERPHAWSPYFYRLQEGKVVTEFYSQVNSSCICVPCTYRELKQQNLPDVPALPDINPQQDTQICLAEVGKIVARNSAPIMALQGKNVIEIDHTIRLRERADHYDFIDTADQIEKMVRQQEENLIKIASKQIRDTGRLYHVKESNQLEYDMDETLV